MGSSDLAKAQRYLQRKGILIGKWKSTPLSEVLEKGNEVPRIEYRIGNKGKGGFFLDWLND